MSVLNIVAWIAGVISFLGLVIAAHRGVTAPIRMGLALIATAALILLFTQNWLALALYGIDILLVLGTWRFSRTRGWKAWIVMIVACLVISKLPGALT
ncbi:MAG: hypothetical protein L0Z53_26880, partial [Acidobacteriales bacterium]|nr:hypothetical protein [Terriglobales bacterium]